MPLEFGAGKERTALHRQPPRVGEHNAAVLAEAGLSAAEVAALTDQGILVAV